MHRLQRQMDIDRRWDSVIDRLEIKYGLHLDSSEIIRYTRAIASLNDRHGWHIDAQKVLSKLGKKLGKKCGKGWISPEKKCKSHYTNGKLNESGKSSGENLADRIRQRKKLSTVSRDGKGKELAYAFLPGNQKQSSMTARRTHAPRSGYQTPGRLSNVNSTEERRSMVGLGQFPGRKVAPDDAPIMDLPTKSLPPRFLTEPTPIGGELSMGERRKSKTLRPTVEGLELKTGQKVWETDLNDNASPEKAVPKERTVVGWSKDGKTVTLRRHDLNAEQSAMARERGKPGLFDRKYPASVLRLSKASALDAVSKANENAAQSREALYTRKRESLEQSAIEARKTRERIANAPVMIPNQRSSSEPRKRGRSVD